MTRFSRTILLLAAMAMLATLAYSPETAGAVIHLDAQFELKNLGATQNETSTIRGHLIVE